MQAIKEAVGAVLIGLVIVIAATGAAIYLVGLFVKNLLAGEPNPEG